MRSEEDIKALYEKAEIRPNSDLKERVLDDATKELRSIGIASEPQTKPSIWRWIASNRISRLAAVAAIVLLLLTTVIELGKPINGTSTVYAVAVDHLKQARTFSCIRSFRIGYQDGEKKGVYLLEEEVMFKEPDKERRVKLTSHWPKYVGETTITDFNRRLSLTLRPTDKTGYLDDMSSQYTFNTRTEKLELTKLDTKLRDRVLELTEGAVEDLGMTELEGKSVRMLQSRRDTRTTTVWVDPDTGLPLQIQMKWANERRSPVTYASIRIDEELDDDLFSLEPPEDYTVEASDPGWSDHQQKMFALMRPLMLACFQFGDRHDRQFPGDLNDLVAEGCLTEAVLGAVLHHPAVFSSIRYRQPDPNAEDRAREVMLYEDHSGETEDGLVVVCMLDSHLEVISTQKLVQYLKPWPGDQKRVSLKMTDLHWFCDRFAADHQGQYPGHLDELVGEAVSSEMIRHLQRATPWGQDGPIVVQYRVPRPGADPATEVIFHEIFDRWPESGVVVCYADGRCEIVVDQDRFTASVGGGL